VNYSQQLESKEWKAKRLQIIKRDNEKCCHCNVSISDFLAIDVTYGFKYFHDFYREELDVFGDISEADAYKNFELLLRNYCSETNSFLVVNTRSFLNRIYGLKETDKDFNAYNIKFFKKINPSRNLEEKACAGLYFTTQNINSFKPFVDFNVHHKFYVLNRNAWEYEDDDLITLCPDCHKKVHIETKILLYDSYPRNSNSSHAKVLKEAVICSKCNGSGYLPEFNYYLDGVCFDCWGHGVNFLL